MKTFLIVGVDTVVGANLAASWSEQARVIGLSSGSKFQWPGCTHAILERSSVEGLRQCLQQMRATHVIFCGAAARSTWEPAGPSFANTDAELWAAACEKLGGTLDQTEIVRYWEEASGVKL